MKVNIAVFLTILFSVLKVNGQQIRFDSKNEFEALVVDSTFKAYYWWDGEEDYTAGNKDSSIYKFIPSDSTNIIEFYPYYTKKLKESGYDSSLIVAYSKTSFLIDNNFNVLKINLPISIIDRLKYLNEDLHKKQEKIILGNLKNEWNLMYKLFQNFDYIKNEVCDYNFYFFTIDGDSILFRGRVEFNKNESTNDRVRFEYSFIADSVELNARYFNAMKRIAHEELNDNTENRIIAFGRIIEGYSIIQLNPTRLIENNWNEKTIEYRADSSKTYWKTEHIKIFNYE